MSEIVNVYSPHGGRKEGQLTREEAIKQGKLIKAVQIWIADKDGNVLVEKRSSSKIHDANMYDVCSGHVRAGETDLEACIREIKEELGENVFREEELESITEVGRASIDLTKYNREGNYLVQWYYLRLNRAIQYEEFDLQEEEVANVRWIPYDIMKLAIQRQESTIRIPYNLQTEILLRKLDKVHYSQIKKKRGTIKIYYPPKKEDKDIGDR